MIFLMGHMKENKKISAMIVAFAAIMVLSMGFLPVATAQTTVFTVALGLNCGLSFSASPQNVAVTPPSAAVFSLDLENNGNSVIPITANAGDIVPAISSPVGGFASLTRDDPTLVHIPPTQITVDGKDGGQAGSNAVTPTTLDNGGAETLVANLAPTTSGGENDPRTMSISAATDNMSNLPVTGNIIADFTLTGNVGGCFIP